MPGLIVMIIAGLGVVRVVRYLRPGFAVAVGLALAGTGYFIVMVTGQNASALSLTVAFAVLGLGIGAAETLSNDLIIAAVPPAKAGAASGVSETSYELGAVLGTAVLGSILTASYSSSIRIPAGLSTEQGDAASQTLGGAVAVARSAGEPLGTALLESARNAFDSGVVLTSGIGCILMVLAVGLALFTLRRERS